eukprot:CAMPEP_0169451462 /NCGR_PEP_ID=MMETSP1042-20121227/13711_1 /TAXON_ID=464988 /ORGANISM="Hemiselmis andersenii, Strain CCMP1180" /LENGTH=612 /DNA_ID=CAMNT_0009563377 /DNA_START=86 /DNA_END=1920 /DNA_ORIENTATION=-
MATVGLERAPKHRHSKPATPPVVRNRFAALQELCRPDREALLFVPGVDGKFNDGARKALNYLLYGCSGLEILESARNHIEQEELLLVISAGTCFLYVGSSEVHDKILPLVGEVPGLQLFTTTDAEAADMDLSEERKIISFLEMIEPFQAIGTELTPRADGKQATDKDRTMEVENWPLIQVYGVEELGNRGFFTMKHSVSDVAEELRGVYSRLDGHAVENVATTHVDMLAFHWETAVSVLDMHTPHERLSVAEQSVAEPLLSFFSYGLLRTADAAEQEWRRPRVSIGEATNDRLKGNGERTVRSGGEGGKVAVHLVMEAAEPNGPIQLARTLFLSSGGAAARARTFDWDGNETFDADDNQLSRAGRSANARCLMAAYRAVMGTHSALVDAFCGGLCGDEEGLRQLAVKTVEGMQVAWLEGTDVEKHLSVQLTATDLAGRRADHSPGSRHTKYLRVELSHIMSLDNPPVDLGAVVFGDSFVDAAGGQGLCLPLTGAVPRLSGWMGAGQEEDTHHMTNLLHRLRASNKHVHTTMGSLVFDDALPGVRMLTGCSDMPSLSGDLWVMQKGLVYTSKRLGSIVLDHEHHIASAEFFQESEAVGLHLKEGVTKWGILEG